VKGDDHGESREGKTTKKTCREKDGKQETGSKNRAAS
jgi:hypothetical protein